MMEVGGGGDFLDERKVGVMLTKEMRQSSEIRHKVKVEREDRKERPGTSPLSLLIPAAIQTKI